MPKTNKVINLALQGGGAHGALTWGIIDRLLEEKNLSFDSISATSAGAMNAAVLACGLGSGGKEGAREALYRFWKKVSDAGEMYNPIKLSLAEKLLNVKIDQSVSYIFFDLVTKIFSPYEFNSANFNPLREILEESIDFEKIRACKKIKIFVSATNVQSGKISIFDNQTISVDALLASACLPFLFQAIEIQGNYYWDGGYMGNPALFPLIYHSDCKDILILHINPIVRETIPKTATEILDRVNEISFNSSLMREMRAVAFMSKLIDRKWIKEEYAHHLKSIYIHAIRADLTMKSASVASKLNSNWSFIQRLYEEGRQQGDAWLKGSFKNIGKKSTIDLEEYL
jgi:NTE family protein